MVECQSEAVVEARQHKQDHSNHNVQPEQIEPQWKFTGAHA
jgi:hypothetical protein